MKIKTKILALFLITVFSLGVAACTAQDNKKTFDYQISHQEDYPKICLMSIKEQKVGLILTF